MRILTAALHKISDEGKTRGTGRSSLGRSRGAEGTVLEPLGSPGGRGLMPACTAAVGACRGAPAPRSEVGSGSPVLIAR